MKRATRRTPRLWRVTIEKRGKRISFRMEVMHGKFSKMLLHFDGTNDYFESRRGVRIDLEPDSDRIPKLCKHFLSLHDAAKVPEFLHEVIDGDSPKISSPMRRWIEGSVRELLAESKVDEIEKHREHAERCTRPRLEIM